MLADATADPVHVAADLISQAEHDPLAAAVLVTDSPALAEATRAELAEQVPQTKHVERIAHRAGRRAVGRRPGRRPRPGDRRGQRVRRRAPGDPDRGRRRGRRPDPQRRARSSSAPWSPVSLGDYCAGSTHVLPTAGCACHSSGLNVKSFLQGGARRSTTPSTALADVARHVEVFAEAEDLPAHGAAVSRRFPRDRGQRHRRPRRRPSLSCRCGPSWSARSRTARRSSTSRSASTSTRTRTRRARPWSPRSRRPSRRPPGSMNRYPERDALALRADLAALPRPRPRRPTRSGPRTAATR